MKLITAIALTLSLPAFAQAASPSPYAGEQSRQIKALSAAEQADLLAGKGMGFARAAELNGYPGPAHVLELASRLELSAEQLAGTQAIFTSMQRQAMALGRQLVAAEQSLDEMFAAGDATPAQLEQSLAGIGDLQARLRGIHLAAHIEQSRLLSEAQKSRYAELRGYAGNSGQGATHDHGHHH